MHRHAAPRTSKCIMAGVMAAAVIAHLACGTAAAQSLSVLPVTIELAPGQMATSLTVVNRDNSETAIQIRAYSWAQLGGKDELTEAGELVASPPLATIAPGGEQLVRIVLHKSPQQQEATYRILLDQIPPPATPGVVRIALRMSIPIFAEPPNRALPHLMFHIDREADQAYLVVINEGGRHATLRDITLTKPDGTALKTEAGSSPYVLAGATQRWRITANNFPLTEEALHLSAHADAGAPVDQIVRVPAAP